MKILYVVTQGEMGGAQKYVLELATHFHGEIAVGAENSELKKQAQSRGIPTYSVRHLVRSINPIFDTLAIFELRKLIRELRPKIVHVNSSKAGVLGSFACWGLPVKVVYTAHGFVFNEPLSPLLKWAYVIAERLASRFRHHIIAVSKADYNSGLAKNIITPEKISVIYNGIEPIPFLDRQTARQKLSLPTDKFIFGSIANLYKTKGLDILIQAIYTLPNEIKNTIQVAIIGSGFELENYKMKIENLGLTNIIKLCGQVPEAGRFLKAFDAFVLPSRKEGFAYTLLEAMQAGLPIVATNVGGNKEALGDTGMIVLPENPAMLAQALQKILDEETLRLALAQKSSERSKEFTLEKTLRNTELVYKKI